MIFFTVASIYLIIGLGFLAFGKGLLKFFISFISGIFAASLPYEKIGIYGLPTWIYVVIFFFAAFGVSVLSEKIHATVLGVFLGL